MKQLLNLGMVLLSMLAFPAIAAVDCKDPVTQAEMQSCANEEFLAAQNAYAQANRTLEKGLTKSQKTKLQRMQKAWLDYRSRACDFESSGVAGGSLQPLLRTQCMTRLTRSHVEVLKSMVTCAEGDAACAPKR